MLQIVSPDTHAHHLGYTLSVLLRARTDAPYGERKEAEESRHMHLPIHKHAHALRREILSAGPRRAYLRCEKHSEKVMILS
jgi:hypothetical protein